MRHKKQDTKICIAFGIDFWWATEWKGEWGKERERGKSSSRNRCLALIPFYLEFCLCNSSRNCLNSKIAASQLAQHWLQTNCGHARACRTAGNDNRQAAILDVDTQQASNPTGLTWTVKASWQTDKRWHAREAAPLDFWPWHRLRAPVQ